MFFDELLRADPGAPLAAHSLAVLTAAVRASLLPGIREVLEVLLASGALVRLGDDCYRAEQLSEIRLKLETRVREAGPISVAQFRDLIGTTRKHAVPLLEYFDRLGLTERSGDLRVLK